RPGGPDRAEGSLRRRQPRGRPLLRRRPGPARGAPGQAQVGVRHDRPGSLDRMCAAVPGTHRTPRSARAAVALAALSLLGSACAANSAPPAIPLQTASRFVVQVADSPNDVRRAPSIAIDKDGNPVVVYLLLVHTLKKGEIPVPILAGQPQPPALLLGSQSNGIWSRVSVTKQGAAPFGKAVGEAEGISFKD